MNIKFTTTLVGLVAVFVLGLWGETHYALAQVPPDFTYEAKPMAPVTFSHKVHVTQNKLQCPACHTKLFQMKKHSAKITMAAINKGEFCGNCHNGKKAYAATDPKNCVRCHKKK
jgi:c(7)-type cytochrome triheme protein